MNKRTWIVTNDTHGTLDLGMPFSLEYLHEWYLRFGDEFPLSGDDKTHALAGGVR